LEVSGSEVFAEKRFTAMPKQRKGRLMRTARAERTRTALLAGGRYAFVEQPISFVIHRRGGADPQGEACR
jgi:hypothetical protein